jgi:glutamate carboxypeptidase
VKYQVDAIKVGTDEAVFQSATDLLTDLCCISSPSGDVAGLTAMAAKLSSCFEEHGFLFEIFNETGADDTEQPVLVGRRSAVEHDYLLVIGHLDTVLPAIPPERLQDRLLATGALDMKGGFATFWGALEVLSRFGLPIPSDLVLLAVPDEEVGGSISEQMTRSLSENARAVLVLEPGEARGDRESVVVGRRGLTGWRLVARGKASHSGLGYWEGRSAIAAAGAWCGQVQKLSQPGSGPTVNVGRILGGDAELVDAIEEHYSIVGTNQRLNMVADRCLAEGEVRFLRAQDGERTLKQMRDLAASIAGASGVQMDLEVLETVDPFDPDGPGASFAKVLQKLARDQGWELELEHDRGGVSFANFLADSSHTLVLDGLGPVGRGMHTREEFLDLNSLRRRIGLLAGLLNELTGD